MNRKQLSIFGATALIVAVTAGLLVKLKSNQRLGEPGVKIVELGDGKIDVVLPEWVLEYTSEPQSATPAEIATLPADTTISRRLYSAPDGFDIVLFSVLMGTDRTSIHKPQFCVEGAGWKIDRTRYDSIALNHPRSPKLPVTELRAGRSLDGRDYRGLYIYWFVTKDYVTERHWERMWWMARDLFTTGRLQRWAYVGCFASCVPGREDAALARMREFLASAVPEFQTTIPKVSDGDVSRNVGAAEVVRGR